MAVGVYTLPNSPQWLSDEFQKARPELLGFARRFSNGCWEGAEDLLQDAFLRAIIYNCSEEIRQPVAWFKVLIERVGLNEIRRRARYRRLLEEIAPTVQFAILPQAYDWFLQELIDAVESKLPPQLHKLLKALQAAQFDRGRAKAALGYDDGKFRREYQRLIEKLREIVDEDDRPPPDATAIFVYLCNVSHCDRRKNMIPTVICVIELQTEEASWFVNPRSRTEAVFGGTATFLEKFAAANWDEICASGWHVAGRLVISSGTARAVPLLSKLTTAFHDERKGSADRARIAASLLLAVLWKTRSDAEDSAKHKPLTRQELRIQIDTDGRPEMNVDDVAGRVATHSRIPNGSLRSRLARKTAQEPVEPHLVN